MNPEAPPRQRVALLTRRPRPLVYSIEHAFRSIERRFPARYEPVWTESPFFSEGIVPRIRTVLWARRHQGDVNHVIGDITFAAMLLPRRRTVLTIHDCEFMERAGIVKRWLYGWLWLRWPIARAAVVTVPSRAVAEDLRRYTGVDPARVRVIAMPLDPVFSPDDRAFDEEEPLVLQVGTRANKNLERVVGALRDLRCRLLVVGVLSDDQRTLLRSAAVAFEEVHGLTDEEVAACYRRADLVVFVSTKEGFGLPVIEAQASGRPVVTSDLAPMRDVAGGAAVMVDPSDVTSIRAGIEAVVGDAGLRGSLVAAGRENVQRFDAARLAEAYGIVYDEVLDAANRP